MPHMALSEWLYGGDHKDRSAWSQGMGRVGVASLLAGMPPSTGLHVSRTPRLRAWLGAPYVVECQAACLPTGASSHAPSFHLRLLGVPTLGLTSVFP